MREKAVLKAELRDESGKGAARKLRARGRVPGVLYGNEVETRSVSIDAREAEHLFQAISVENTLVDLDLTGEDEPIPTLVREIQVHPYRPDLLHVDFYRIQAGVKVEVEIPVHLLGTPTGVKNSGGVLQQVIHDLPVRVLPSQIPEYFELDIEPLEIGDSLHVSDLEVGEEAEVLLDPDRTVVTVVVPREIEVEEEEEVEEIEVPLVDEEGEPLEGEELEAAREAALAEAEGAEEGEEPEEG